MKYFLDTEFIEYPPQLSSHTEGIYTYKGTIDLLSIALVSEDHRTIYMSIDDREVDKNRANPWAQENVLPHINHMPKVTRLEAREHIIDFIGDDPEPEFWAYYADYDWVAFCWLFGAMIDLPEHFPKYCLDIKQLMHTFNIKRDELPPDPADAHNALADALHNKRMYNAIEQRLHEGEKITI